MVCIDNTFSAKDSTKVRLDTFLALFDLLISHWLDFAPLICEILRKVDGVLPLIKYADILFFGTFIFLL